MDVAKTNPAVYIRSPLQVVLSLHKCIATAVPNRRGLKQPSRLLQMFDKVFYLDEPLSCQLLYLNVSPVRDQATRLDHRFLDFERLWGRLVTEEDRKGCCKCLSLSFVRFNFVFSKGLRLRLLSSLGIWNSEKMVSKGNAGNR